MAFFFVSGTTSSKGATSVSLTPANPVGIASLGTYLMCGLGVDATYPTVMTPKLSGIVRFTMSGTINNTVAADTTNLKLFYGTGTPPSNQGATTGTAIITGSQAISTNGGTSTGFPFCVDVIITGLTLNTAMWVDAALDTVVGGTGSISGLFVTMEELPY